MEPIIPLKVIKAVRTPDGYELTVVGELPTGKFTADFDLSETIWEDYD